MRQITSYYIIALQKVLDSWKCWVHCLEVAGVVGSTTGAAGTTKQALNGRYTFTPDLTAPWTLWVKEMPLKVLMNAFCRRGLDAQKCHLSRLGPALPRAHRGCCELHTWHHLLSGPRVVAFVPLPLSKRALKAFSSRPSLVHPMTRLVFLHGTSRLPHCCVLHGSRHDHAAV